METRVSVADARGLQRLAEVVGEAFVMGIVLYTGTTTVQLGNDVLDAVENHNVTVRDCHACGVKAQRMPIA
jgi:hypothetical protein